VNPLASHWFRLAVWLFLASPIVATMVALTAHADFTLALVVTLYMWAAVCAILALIAAGGLVYRLVAGGIRALRR
jgi:hypothetical protein